MTGIQRDEVERARLQARARALREQGLTMAQVSDETGVSETTLNRWARRGSWRLSDMAGKAPGVAAVSLDANIPDDIPDLPPEEAASVLVARASRYALAGQMARSAVAARLARQLIELSLRQAEVAALKATADLASRRRLPAELVGLPLDEDCRPLEFPEGWDMARAEKEGRMDLVPIERLRDDLRERLIVNPPAWMRDRDQEAGEQAGQDAEEEAADPEQCETAENPPAAMTDDDRLTDAPTGSVTPETPADTGPRIRSFW